jgi:hypothetical protein
VRRALLLLLAGCSAAPRGESDWERAHVRSEPPPEEQPAPPAYPRATNLVAFRVDGAPGFRFFLDRGSIVPGKDGVVRYVLVARSPEGSDNVTYEGMRCSSAEQRIYAVGQPGGGWTPARGDWRPLAAPRHITLYRDYLCPFGAPVASASTAVRSLERDAMRSSPPPIDAGR